VIVSCPATFTEESIQKKKKAEKVYFYLWHNKLKKANLDQVFSESRSGTTTHKNKKTITAVTRPVWRLCDVCFFLSSVREQFFWQAIYPSCSLSSSYGA
jgi:hypothetical protein